MTRVNAYRKRNGKIVKPHARRTEINKNIILRRNKKQEDTIVHLWYQDSKMDFIVSLGGEKRNVSLRISTPKGNKEYLLPFADISSIKYEDDDFGKRREFRNNIERIIKRDFGYNVQLVE